MTDQEVRDVLDLAPNELAVALARDLLAAREALRAAVNAAHSAECIGPLSKCQDAVCVAALTALGDPR